MISLQKILIICGPTATGKTSLAIKLAKQLNGEIISADSRQVYQDMDIGTGKDIPKEFRAKKSELSINHRPVPVYSNGTKIWGYDLVKPTQEFSAAHFTKFARLIISSLLHKSQLPLVVGGTGLYLQSLFSPPDSLYVPPNKRLRNQLAQLNRQQLQYKLRRTNLSRFNTMNKSDRSNPRRLIRAIEIALNKSKTKPPPKPVIPTNILWIGLKSPLKLLDKKINQRVINRAQSGMTTEVKTINLKSNSQLPSITALGYKQWKKYLDKKISRAQAISQWQQAEKQYARRQLTWFKKNPAINWFDVSQSNYQMEVVAKVKNWYATSNG